MLPGLAACHSADAPVRLTFEMHSAHVAEASLRFYVSDLAMIDAEGHATPVELATSPWQDAATALVALGGPTENRVVTGKVPPGSYAAVGFLLGVPADRNHANPLAATPPLNVPSMFWTWQSGYKFVRLDVGNAWSFHLGSTGCVSASAVRPPQEPCGAPNAPRIRLRGDGPEIGTIEIDVDALLAEIDVSTDDNCMASYAGRETCRGLLARLGMDANTGLCVDDCEGQTVFRFVP